METSLKKFFQLKEFSYEDRGMKYHRNTHQHNKISDLKASKKFQNRNIQLPISLKCPKFYSVIISV
jgi:hypothetical protein